MIYRFLYLSYYIALYGTELTNAQYIDISFIPGCMKYKLFIQSDA